MNTPSAIVLFCLLVSPCLNAQDRAKEPGADSVLEAIQQFKSQHSGKPNEVTVVLDPPADTPPKKADKQKNADPSLKKSAPTDKQPEPPPVAAERAPDKSREIPENPAAAPEEPPAVNPGKPREGLSVKVAKLKSGNANIDPAKVKLLAPFPAKPLSPAPPGWLLQATENVPPLTREIELSDGKKITLSIRPHLLVPNIDGTTVFSVLEPNFDPSLAYQQTATVGAILSNSITQLENDSKQMGVAIDKIQQILASLPKPDPASPPSVTEPVKPTPKRKR